MTGPTPTVRSIDPVTFEILRHRFWAINEEASSTIRLVSGSPVAVEANDINNGLMTAAGDVFVVGYYSLNKAITISAVVKDILHHYQDNPGIFPDDGFICNDPYCGVMHANDVAYLTPIHWEGMLLGWFGAEIHLVDVGGPVPGQVQLGAKDAFGEQPIFPPIKLIERGVMRRDLEREYLRHTRLPDLVALDLRAKIAAGNVARERVLELVREFGPETVREVMDGIIRDVEERFRARLRELPDGIWRHRMYIDFEDQIFPVAMAAEKRGDALTFDLTGTARQAPAVINVSPQGASAVIWGEISNSLCWDIPWCPAGIARVVRIISEPGTLCHAVWPAGVSKSTTSIGHALRDLVNVVLGKMLASSEAHHDRAMACWQATNTHEELFGTDQRGEPFGQTLLDGMAGGTGATPVHDGIDTGGKMNAMATIIANVETYEYKYPILYLHRKHVTDSGGAGTYRGGNGMSIMYIAHNVPEIPEKIMHCWGVEQPITAGIGGGYPSATNLFEIKRGTSIRRLLASSQIPDEPSDVPDGTLEIYPPVARTHLDADDVYRCVDTGGGGYGDPLLRDPHLVARDIANRAVSVEFAREMYGVALTSSGDVDQEATRARREAIRRARLAGAQASGHRPAQFDGTGDRTANRQPPDRRIESWIARVSEYLVVVQEAGEPLVCCRLCGFAVGPVSADYKERVLMARFPVTRAGPRVNPHRIHLEHFEFREFYCPGCLVLLETEVARPGEPSVRDVEIFVGAFAHELHRRG
jgi:N-methylhydantoinase B